MPDPKPESEFDRIVREAHEEARREEARDNGEHIVPGELDDEWTRRYAPLDDDDPLPGTVPGGRFRRRYNWRRAAEMLADGVDWRQACAAIGCRHKAMLRMLRHSAQFRRMLAEERRLRAEAQERRLELMLLKLPFLIEKQVNAGDKHTIRWLFRRSLGVRPNQVAEVFAETRPERREADLVERVARRIGRAATERIARDVACALPRPDPALAMRMAAPEGRDKRPIASNKDQ